MNSKRLTKSSRSRMLCGVCGGIGEFLGVDPTIIRVLMAIFGCTGAGIVAYIACAVIMPEG